MSGSSGSGGTGSSARKRLMKEEDMTKVEFETSEEVDVTPTFDTMGLREDLLRGIYAYGARGSGGAGEREWGVRGRWRRPDAGPCACAVLPPPARWRGRPGALRETTASAGFEKPSAIQQRAIKQIIKGRDVIAQ